MSNLADTSAQDQEGAASWRTPAGRRSDHASALLARLMRGRSRDSAVLLGQLLMVACGTVFILTTPLLSPTPRAWATVGVVSAVMAAALTVSHQVRWSRLPRWAPLSMPLLVWAAMAFLGLREGMAMPYAGFWVLTSQLLVAMTSRQSQLATAMRTAAHTDALTGLANRRDLDARLGTLCDGDTVVICDLDHFKALNDRWGHTTGDRVLADFGTLLRTGLREDDYAARYGGEEFALLLPATTAAQAGAVTDRLRERWALLQPGTTFSAGTATLTPGAGPAEVVAAADAATVQQAGSTAR